MIRRIHRVAPGIPVCSFGTCMLYNTVRDHDGFKRAKLLL
jgi:hypothetical protein